MRIMGEKLFLGLCFIFMVSSICYSQSTYETLLKDLEKLIETWEGQMISTIQKITGSNQKFAFLSAKTITDCENQFVKNKVVLIQRNLLRQDILKHETHLKS
jgi:chaperonin GroEL (HSP60 family)